MSTVFQSDARVAAFCSPDAPEVFRSVAYPNDVWTPDPFDVEGIHNEAREAFSRLLNLATFPDNQVGRILLIRGESGSGKTHLMRAFRSYAHERGLAYFGYMQMTSSSGNYVRYMLNKLIDSLDRPYYTPHSDQSGLMRLSNSVVESLPAEEVESLREEDLSDSRRSEIVDGLADRLVADKRFSNDLDLMRAMLLLQCESAPIRSRVIKYLRGEPISENDRNRICGIVPKGSDEESQQLIEHLGRLMWRAQSSALVLCIDQLEDIVNVPDREVKFRRAMQTLCAIAGEVPTSVLLISCVDDYYTGLRDSLTRPYIDRIEKDPQPIFLKAGRSLGDIEEIIETRLEYLYRESGLDIEDTSKLFPFDSKRLKELTNQRARSVLHYCHDFRQACIQAGTVVQGPTTVVEPEPGDGEKVELEQAWNDFQSSWQKSPPESESELASVLADAIEACGAELDTGHDINADASDNSVNVHLDGGKQSEVRLMVGICNKSAKGSGLQKQIEQIEKLAKNPGQDHLPVITRSTDFPASAKAKVVKHIVQLIKRGGRRVVVQDTDWRTMHAMREFRALHAGASAFDDWLRDSKPLSQLQSLRDILNLNGLKPVQVVEKDPPSTGGSAVQTKPKPAVSTNGDLVIEHDAGGKPIYAVTASEFNRHAAFIGGTGSGKTTLAMNLVEQLLLQGIPCLLVDRKGDLCRYAQEHAWQEKHNEPVRADRLKRLEDSIDVAVFTPGHPGGRPLALSIVPDGLKNLPAHERNQLARFAAHSLGSMLGYKHTGTDGARLAVLVHAIELLGLQAKSQKTLSELIDFIDPDNDDLVAKIGKLDIKHFKRLTEDLESLKVNKANVLSADGEPLDADLLFGRGSYESNGKTRLTVISTKFLGDLVDMQFWVSQLLMELGRWMSKNPAVDKPLQAVAMFDESDLYLPATGKPPTKQPMEDLLKRARSAGLGVFLATQSPGDFDYKCRDNIQSWFVGRVKETTALNKLQPMLTDCGAENILEALPNQTAGHFHFVRTGKAEPVHSDLAAVMPDQIPEDEILLLAGKSRPKSQD